MIEQLINKSSNEKYHQSLIYLSHLLKGDKKVDFIKRIASQNVLLACKCVMTSEKNVLLENYLSELAFNLSIEDDTRVNGLLSLFELNRYELISSAFSKITKIDKNHRYSISQIISEIDSDNIVKFLKIILEPNTKGLVGTLISSVDNRNIEFTSSQKSELEGMFSLVVSLFGFFDRRTLRYLKVFNLAKKLIPKKILNLPRDRIKGSNINFQIDFFAHFDIPFPYSNEELCDIFLSRNKYSDTIAFGKYLFKIDDINTKSSLIKKALAKGKYFSAFIISLIESWNDRKRVMLLFPEDFISYRRINQFENLEHPKIDQNYLIEIIENSDIFSS